MNESLIEVVQGRNNPMIDPSLHIWGWEIPVYLFLGGVVAGMLVLSAALALRDRDGPRSKALQTAPLLALGLLSVGMAALFLDLEHKAYVWRFYLAFKAASPMSWGSWILLLVYPAGIMMGFGMLDSDRRAALLDSRFVRGLHLRSLVMCILGRADAARRGALWAGIIAGSALGLYTGILLGTMVSMPLWNTAVLGPLFLTSGVSTGAAVLLLLPLSTGERHVVARWDMAAIFVEIVLIVVMLIGFATGGHASHVAFSQLVDGPSASAFWALVVVAGLAAPFTLEAIEVRRSLKPLALTPILVLIGGLSLRWILVIAGQASSWANIP
ncbi:MAG: polysulfide reductase NrfD [Deltaproteobacteria bacterium]|nr:polysulfide reductase NrfD [Deltaproteobacteria bacterium]